MSDDWKQNPIQSAARGENPTFLKPTSTIS
jgi:hypothetical protein